MNEVVIQSLIIIIPLSALLLAVHYLRIRQLKTIENRLSKEIRESADRLCADIRDLSIRVAEPQDRRRRRIRGDRQDPTVRRGRRSSQVG